MDKIKGVVYVDLNKKSREKRNLSSSLKAHITKEHLKYIALRDGSEIGNIGHSLFGRINQNEAKDMELKDITKNFIDATKNGAEVIKSVISLSEEDALKYGYNNKDKWQELINSKIREIAKEYNIKFSNLNYVATFHQKDGNPHCHIVFFDKSLEKKKRKYINYEKIRAEFNKEIYHENLERIYDVQNKSKNNIPEFMKEFRNKLNLDKISIDKDSPYVINSIKYLNKVNKELEDINFIYDKEMPRNYIKIEKIENDKINYYIDDRKINKLEAIKYMSIMQKLESCNSLDILKEKINEEENIRSEISMFTPFNTPNKYFSNKIYEKELNAIESKIVDFIDRNKNINFRYKYLTSNQKKEIDEISKLIVKSTPDIKNEFKEYVNSKIEISKIIYPDNFEKLEKVKEYSKNEIYTKIGNQLLKFIKEKKFEEFKNNKEEYEKVREITKENNEIFIVKSYKNTNINNFVVLQGFLNNIFQNLQNENKRLNGNRNYNKNSSLSKQTKKEKMLEKKNASSIDWSR